MFTTSTLLLSFASLLAPQDAKAKVDPPKPEPAEAAKPEPAEAAKDIREAIKQGAAPARAILGKLGGIPDKDVTAAVATALKHKEQDVQLAAIYALRFNKDGSAFRELYKVRGTKLILGKPDIAGDYYLALGQHANKKVLPFMLRDLKARGRYDKVIGKRLLALGRMRDRSTVDALIKFTRGNRRHAREAITSLVVLTGRNEGNSWVPWARWWKANRASFELPEEEPELDKRNAKTWSQIWADPRKSSAQKVPTKKAPTKKAARKQRRRAKGGDAKGGIGQAGKDSESDRGSPRDRRRDRDERKHKK